MNQKISRRHFLGSSAIAGAAFYIGRSSSFGQGKSANNKLNIGIIGTHNRAASNIKGVLEEMDQNIVAVCDVDDKYLAETGQRFPEAKRYNDFRKLMDQKDIEAVVISTTDHTHAFATAMALKSGRHVYCEKPLTHDVHETRIIAKLAAANKKLATQMGTQIHATNNYRRVVELIRSGAIGKVHDVHIWIEKSRYGGKPQIAEAPKSLHWDLWVGPAAERPYNTAFHPRGWRAFWNFGSGTLGDMGCHYLDLPFWALDLKLPTAIETEGPQADAEVTPEWMVAKYDFAPSGDRPPVKLTWYDGVEAGGRKPQIATEAKVADWRNAVLFVGDKGMLAADYSKYKLLPESKFAGFTPSVKSIPNSIGHYKEWFEGCKQGKPTSCNFAYGALLTETVQLGNVAFRVGKKLEWDAAAMKAKNAPEAANFLQRDYRAGWTL